MPRKLYAITLHRPWPYAIINLGKRIENRTWHLHLLSGSPIVIHAGKAYDRRGADWIRYSLGLDCPPDGAEHPTGIVAIAKFQGNTEFEIDPWFMGPVGWVLTDIKAVSPISIPGKQGLWVVPDEIASQLGRGEDAA